ISNHIPQTANRKPQTTSLNPQSSILTSQSSHHNPHPLTLTPHTSTLSQQLLCHCAEAAVLQQDVAASVTFRFIFSAGCLLTGNSAATGGSGVAGAAQTWGRTIIVMWLTKKRLSNCFTTKITKGTKQFFYE
ncbi:MAG TPA: hypothetical protein VJ943_05740, partial [Desulfotignum sp.]|nr:hypothetical protein [Desulfotignum sp.]